jgi:hypothetical protein
LLDTLLRNISFGFGRKRRRVKGVKDTDMRVFRIGLGEEKYSIATPIAEQFEDNWDFAGSLE